MALESVKQGAFIMIYFDLDNTLIDYNFHACILQLPIVLILLSSTFLPFGQEVSLAQRARSIQIFYCFQSLLKTESYLRFAISNSFLT